MQIRLLRAKIHHATVTHINPDYHGSITIPRRLLKASGLLPNEAVLIADATNGNRFETYIIPGAVDSEAVEINGAAALLSGVSHLGDHHELCGLRTLRHANTPRPGGDLRRAQPGRRGVGPTHGTERLKVNPVARRFSL